MNKQAQQFCEWYGDGHDGSCPTAKQWARILTCPPSQPITLVNFFKLRENACYGSSKTDRDVNISGNDAFNRYASVSIPAMENIGGKFLHIGPFVGTFLGDEEEWDVTAIGAYPNVKALVALYTDRAYREAFVHRTAACARQKVLICAAAE